MSDVPQNTPTPPEPTTPPPPSPEPAPPSPVVDPPKPEGEGAPKSIVTEPAPEPFDADKLTLPEGFEKGEHFDQFTEWSKEAGITQPQAQKLIDLYKASSESASTKIYDAWREQNEKWQNEVKGDQELGGTKLEGVRQTISKLLDNPELSDPKFREALDYTGAGNNPAVIRTLYRWAQKLSEGAPVAGNPASRDGNGRVVNEPVDLATAIYGPTGPHAGGPNLERR